MSFLIVGLGSIGRRHLQNLHLLGFKDIRVLTKNRCALPNNDLPDFKLESDLDEALSYQPTAVLICNPSAYHMEVAIKAAEQGCHLFLEKPVSHSMDGVEYLWHLAIDRLLVQVGFQFRFHPVLNKLKYIINLGGIGRIISVHAHWGEYLPDWHPWEDYRLSYSAQKKMGGGVILTLCHPFDYLHWICGPAANVFATGGQLSDLELDTEDTVMINIQYQNGIIGQVYLDYIQKPAKHCLDIVGTKGKMEWNNATGEATIYYKNPYKKEVIKPILGFERNDLFIAELEDFIHCLKTGNAPKCNLIDGIQALQIALAAKHSIAKEKVVPVDYFFESVAVP